MPIDFKDEYATLRQEMLECFSRIHDTAKYGTGAFIGFLSYYYVYHDDVDVFIALIVSQLLVALIGIPSLCLYHSIYDKGTYIMVIIEKNSEAKWHGMSRRLSDFGKECNKTKGFWQWPFPFGKRWGEDSAQLAILLIFLTLTGLGVVFLRESTSTWSTFWPSCVLQCFRVIIIIILFGSNVTIIYKLLWGMRNYREVIEETWEKYHTASVNGSADK